MVLLCLVLVPVLALLPFYVRTFRSMCAVPNMAVFCSSLTSWFPDMSLTYFLNNLEMVPVAPIITGITLVFTFNMRCISIVRSLCYYYYYYYYLLQLSFHSVAVTLTLVTNENKYTQKKQYKNTVQTLQNTINTSSGRTEVNRDKLVVRTDV